MWSKHRLLNAFIRNKYARGSFARFAAASSDTDVLALSILPSQRPFNWWTRRFINIDSRKFDSDKTIEVLYHCQKSQQQQHIYRNTHTIFSWIFQQISIQFLFFHLHVSAKCEKKFLPNEKKSIKRTVAFVWFAWWTRCGMKWCSEQ